MKYKVGDKVRVRSDLKCEEYYGGITFNFEMNKFKGMEITIARVNYGGYYEVLETPYNFTDEMLEPVEEMTAEEAVKRYTEFGGENICTDCPIQTLDTTYYCPDIRQEYPEDVVKVLKQWKADHEKKPIETENVMYIVVMDEKRNVVYEEKTNEAVITSTMKEEVLKKYCTEHDGKYYAISERRCAVKE